MDYIKASVDAPRNASRVLKFSGWRLDLGRRRLESPDGLLVGLTSGEFEMLVAFVEHPQRVLSRDQLLDLTRGRDSSPFDRSIDVQVSRLRRKIEPDPKVPSMIVTVRGDGYEFTQAVETG
jgi:two-component system OmpR family response regulator